MLSETFKLYYDSTLALVRSMVFKFDIQNTLINQYLKNNGLTVDEDPLNWKYYKNLAGEYYETDTMMTVISSDTQEEINFTRDVLVDHPRTVLLHAQGTSGYKALVSRFPKQELLINGIIRPIDKQLAIEANDFQLLDYDRSLIAINETTLIARIQKWVDIHSGRHWNPDYALSDPLYPAAFLGQMAMFLVPVIMGLRDDKVHTNEASQFEIWTYLSGHYNLDNYKGYLSLNQSLWLYRNINNIRKNAGSVEELERLMTHITAPAGLKISRLDFIQLDDVLLSKNTRTPLYSKTNYYEEQPNLASGNTLTTQGVFELTEDYAPYNINDIDTDTESALVKGTSLVNNHLPTKIFQADEDGTLLSQSVANLPMKVNYWAYLSYLELYESDFSISVPNGADVFLSAKDAFTLFMYAGNRSVGNTPATIPEIEVKSVIPLTYPNAAELFALTDHEEITLSTITDMLTYLVDLRALSNRDDFITFISEVQNQDYRFLLEEGFFRHPLSRSQFRDVVNGLQTNVRMRTEPDGTRYDDWLFERGIDSASLTDRDWWDLANNILSEVVDYSDNSTTVGARQRAMVEILDALTCYDIMILNGDSSERKREIWVPSLLVYDITAQVPFEEFIPLGEMVQSDSIPRGEMVIAETIEQGSVVSLPESDDLTLLIESGEETLFAVEDEQSIFVDISSSDVYLESIT